MAQLYRGLQNCNIVSLTNDLVCDKNNFEIQEINSKIKCRENRGKDVISNAKSKLKATELRAIFLSRYMVNSK